MWRLRIFFSSTWIPGLPVIPPFFYHAETTYSSLLSLPRVYFASSSFVTIIPMFTIHSNFSNDGHLKSIADSVALLGVSSAHHVVSETSSPKQKKHFLGKSRRAIFTIKKPLAIMFSFSVNLNVELHWFGVVSTQCDTTSSSLRLFPLSLARALRDASKILFNSSFRWDFCQLRIQ